jgi:hypothetical protein
MEFFSANTVYGDGSADNERVPRREPTFPPTPLSLHTGPVEPSSCESLSTTSHKDTTRSRASYGKMLPGKADMVSGSGFDDFPSRPKKSSSLDERFGYILGCSKDLGFDSFDDLASAYYTSEFEDSGLFGEQRVSRMRRLPEVLASLREHSMRWSQWERQGYQNEILQLAESILVEECIKFTQNDMLKKEMLFLGQKSHDSDRPTPILDSAIRKILQNEVSRSLTLNSSKFQRPVALTLSSFL